jgi:hypothetical protein
MKHFWMALIAIGLWANAAALWIKPATAQFDATNLLKNIDANVEALAHGGLGCHNTKICD